MYRNAAAVASITLLSRSFTLPHGVDEAKVVAKYADGVLKLTLPTKSKSASRKITVN